MGDITKPVMDVFKRYFQILVILFCIYLAQHGYSDPLLPTLKIVHVENVQSDLRKIPDKSRFKDLDQKILTFNSDLSDGYWVKPILPNAVEFETGYLFAVSPVTIYQTEVYIPSLSTAEPVYTRNRFDINSSPKFSHRAQVFELPDDFVSGSDVYFYLESRSDQELKIEYWEHDEYLIQDRKNSSLYSAIFASLFVLVLVNFIFFIAIRDLNYLAYVFYLVSVLFFIMLTTGKIYEFGFGKILAGNYNGTLALYSLTCLSFTIFVQNFLKLKLYTPLFHKFTQFAVLFFTGMLLTALFVWPVPYVSFNIVNYFALLALLPLTFCVIKIWLKGHRQAKYFLLAFMPLIATISVRLLAVLDYIPNWNWALEGFQIAVVFQAIILSVGLADQMLELRKQRDEAQLLSSKTKSILQTEKDFSKFLSRITDSVRAKPSQNHDELIINSFFDRLKQMYNIERGAIIYQIDTDLKVMSNNEINQSAFYDYVHDHITDVSRVCHNIELKELTVYNHPLFSRFTKMLVIPVHMRGHEWSGMLINLEVSRKLSSDQYDSLQRFATELVRAIVNAHNLNHFSIKAETDSLTQVLNRGAILDVLSSEIEHFKVSQLPLCIAFMDIDHFKKINDNLGHEAGDMCLAYLALQIRRYLPEGSFVGRMGGDEFLFIFPNHEQNQTRDILSGVSNSLETLIIEDVECSFTLSIGIARYNDSRQDIKTFLRNADDALYKAKQNGRAQIAIAA